MRDNQSHTVWIPDESAILGTTLTSRNLCRASLQPPQDIRDNPSPSYPQPRCKRQRWLVHTSSSLGLPQAAFQHHTVQGVNVHRPNCHGQRNRLVRKESQSSKTRSSSNSESKLRQRSTPLPTRNDDILWPEGEMDPICEGEPVQQASSEDADTSHLNTQNAYFFAQPTGLHVWYGTTNSQPGWPIRKLYLV